MYSPDELRIAKKKVKAKKQFYRHLATFVIVNLFLFALNMITTPFYWWFGFPLLGWGMGLAFHYVDVFGIPGFDILSHEWEDQQLETELRKMKDEETQQNPKRLAGKTSREELELKELRKNYDESELV
ncbi:MAG: 2TM domain-containing protein [Saprospiraceae bacterium]